MPSMLPFSSRSNINPFKSAERSGTLISSASLGEPDNISHNQKRGIWGGVACEGGREGGGHEGMREGGGCIEEDGGKTKSDGKCG